MDKAWTRTIGPTAAQLLASDHGFQGWKKQPLQTIIRDDFLRRR